MIKASITLYTVSFAIRKIYTTDEYRFIVSCGSTLYKDTCCTEASHILALTSAAVKAAAQTFASVNN